MVEQQSLDELALLGDDNGTDKFYTGEINEDELLGLTEQTSHETTNNNPITSITEETEQLDYEEEDEEERKPREKFVSERKQETPSNTVDTDQKAGNKCFVNPKFQNKMPNSNNSGPQQNQLPSLLSQSVMPPRPPMMQGPVDVNAMTRMVLMNSLRPIGPPNQMMPPMNAPGFPNPSFPPPGMPPNMMANRPPGPITAQIGQLSTVIQQNNDGVITFRTTIPPPSQPTRVIIARAGCSDAEPNQNKDWDSMVNDFLKGPSKSKKRSRSPSSRSRSYSNSSFSGSYTDSFSSRSPSRSPSPRRHRRRRSPSRKRHRSSYRRSSYRSHRRGERSRHSPRRRRGSKTNELKNTIECAETVGLDDEYMRKLEEQKKLRDEMARQKYQRDEKRSSRRTEESSSSSSRHRRVEEPRPKVESKPAPVQEQPASTNGENKVKPYLVVVISNLSNLSDAYKRLKMIALAVGPTKKVWQTSEDSVSIIFEKHEDAKNFMLQYHMKQFNGCTLSINLEKIFLNLASIP